MEDRKHYPADVLVGAAIGLIAGREVSSREGLGWVFGPVRSGIGISIRF
jgi:hypothetical protein